MNKLQQDLANIKSFNFLAGDARYAHAQRRTVAHEFGHRFTLGHPMFIASLSANISDSPLQMGEIAALKATTEVPPKPRFPGDVRSVLKIRAIVEERDIPDSVLPRRADGSLRAAFNDLQTPLAIHVGSTLVSVDLSLDPKFVFGPTMSATVSLVENQAEGTRIQERTITVLLNRKLTDAELELVRQGHGTVEVQRNSHSETPWQGLDFMDGGGGSYYFPTDQIPEGRLRLLQMRRDRALDPTEEVVPR